MSATFDFGSGIALLAVGFWCVRSGGVWNTVIGIACALGGTVFIVARLIEIVWDPPDGDSNSTFMTRT